MKKQFILLCLIFVSLILKSQTTVPGGPVSGTWTLSGSPYLVQGSIMVPNDSTLKIQPGVTVNFKGHYKLLVSGRLLAIGTAKDSIIFTTSDTTTGWYGIRFDNTASTNDSSRISYCVLQLGIAAGTGVDQYGGGILFNNFSKVNVNHSTLRTNSNFQIYCTGSSPLISNCNISFATIGGGIYVTDHSVPLITGNIISYNTGSGIRGTLNSTDHLTILNNTISHNTDVGIFFTTGNCTISNNIITYNSLNNSTPGGIWCDHASGTITNNVISYNHGGSGYGGGIFSYFTSGSIVNNFISNNTAESGGGIFCTGTNGNPTITNNVIVNNTALGATGKGGGIYCVDNSNPTLINNTISNNEAAYGGGLYCNFICNPAITNCIFYGNTASAEGAQVHLEDEKSDPSFLYCDIQGGSTAFGLNGNFFSGAYVNNILANPKYTTPSAGSGITYPGLLANWSLQATSPCINRGNPAGSYPLVDIAGNPRVDGTLIDIGAYERPNGVGIENNSELYHLSIYPNPFKDYTIVKLPSTLTDMEYRIYNGYGQLLKTGFEHSGNSLIIQRADLAEGLYFVEILQGDHIRVKEKLVIAD
jgi:parallel beta-helix repeat protein